jgi:hypothetical protein
VTRRNMSVEVTSGVAATEVEKDNALDFAEAYEHLAKLPVNRQVSVDFPVTDYTDLLKKDGTVKLTALEVASAAARDYVKQGKAWAAAQEITVDVLAEDGKTVTGQYTTPLTFARKGDIKGNPTRVSFRIYVPRPEKDAE